MAISIAGASALASWPVQSAEYGYTVGGGLEYTDNVDLAPTDPKSDLIYILNGGYKFSDQSAHLDLAMGLAGQLQIHRDANYDNEFLGAANVAATWKPYPSLFHWVLEDVYTPTIDPQDKPTVSNFQHANIFSTGPDTFFRFGPVDTLNVGGRVVDARYQAADGDNTGTLGYLRWLHRTSERTTLSLNHERENVNYKDKAEDDFRQIKNFAGLDFQSARDRFNLNYGYSIINREHEDTIRTHIGSVIWDRFISGRTQFNFRLTRDLGNADTDVVRQTQNQQNPGAVNTSNTTDVYVLREAVMQLRWGITPGTGRASSIGVFWNDREYEIDKDSNEQDQGATLNIVWPFTPLLYATVNGSYTERDFYGIKRRDDETVLGAGMNYLLTRRTTIGAYVRHANNNSTDPTEEYVENRFGIFIAYAISGNRRY